LAQGIPHNEEDLKSTGPGKCKVNQWPLNPVRKNL